jgi:sodium/potassium-transporting ATPase subunit alpha
MGERVLAIARYDLEP